MSSIKFIFPILTYAILASCDQQTSNPKADQFPGFSQIGADKQTSRLFVDFESVKRDTNGSVSFKLLRVLDNGYAIQDALTDCRANFKGLAGTKYKNDGATDSEYKEDAQAFAYASDPSLSAMVNKVCEKSDESRVIVGAFDDIKALELAYGPYHPEAKAASWADITPPATAPQSTSDFKGKNGVVKIILSQEYKEDNNVKHILLTQTQLADESNDCHACAPLLGVLTFVQVGNKWRFESENRFLTVMGAYGSPPELAWVNIGKDMHVVTVKMTDIHQGIVSAFLGAYKLDANNWQPLLEWLEESETISDFGLTFSQASNQTYSDAIIKLESETEGKKTLTEKKYIFNGLKFESSDPSTSTTAVKTEQKNQDPMPESEQPVAETGPSMVNRMLEYAMNDGGLNFETQIQEVKLRLENLPKPGKGDRKSARKINDEALLLLKNNDYDGAVKLLTDANKLDPSDLEIINNLGYSLLKQGNLESAQQMLINALVMSPGRTSAWANLGDVFGAKGDINRSVACFSNGYRFSQNRLKTYQFMKDLNERENIEALKQARSLAIAWVQRSYPEISESQQPSNE